MLNTLCNRRDFDRLPLLLTYSQVISCGINERGLKELVEAGAITFVKMKAHGRKRYRKKDVAKILGFDS